MRKEEGWQRKVNSVNLILLFSFIYLGLESCTTDHIEDLTKKLENYSQLNKDLQDRNDELERKLQVQTELIKNQNRKSYQNLLSNILQASEKRPSGSCHDQVLDIYYVCHFLLHFMKLCNDTLLHAWLAFFLVYNFAWEQQLSRPQLSAARTD